MSLLERCRDGLAHENKRAAAQQSPRDRLWANSCQCWPAATHRCFFLGHERAPSRSVARVALGAITRDQWVSIPRVSCSKGSLALGGKVCSPAGT